LPCEQSASLTHAFKHAVAPHANGAQSRTTFAGHAVAAPLQAVASVSLPPLQEAGLPQAVPPLLAGWMHPTAVSQASAVHGFVSAQSMAGPLLHAPAEHVSFDVQALPSLHAAPFATAGFEQTPVPVLHVPAVWHWSSAAQATGFAPVHLPAWQVSDRVQALPSLHAVPFAFGTGEQVPFAGLQVPTLQASSRELQLTAVPDLQAKSVKSQVSTPLQALASSQPALFRQPQARGSAVHWAAESLQPSVVQTIPSLQSRAGPPQTPFVQVSGVVQNRPSSHGVAFALFGLLQAPFTGLQAPALWH
jgi:hypothetical protein